jgi:hypothetical protein
MPDNIKESGIEQSLALEEFLGSMVEAVVKAQTILDRCQEGNGQSSETLYTIPSASLEIKVRVATKKEETRKAYVFFGPKTSTEAGSELNSTLTLNIVAIPRTKSG